jgi:hypothetical protein
MNVVTASQTSFEFAIVLSLGSLVLYLIAATLMRRRRLAVIDEELDFNLGLPKTRDSNSLFATALVAAGTSLSTVFVFFLTAAALFGWWLLLAPAMFAIGNWFMFRVFARTDERGYLSEAVDASGASGLLPYLGRKLTGSRAVAITLILLSLLNLLAVLVLELSVGVDVIGYLVQGATGLAPSTSSQFIVFGLSMALMLGYVFVGGFRAVVLSDIWQIKAMQAAILLTTVSLAFVAFRMDAVAPLSSFTKTPPPIVLYGFIANVILANLFAPLSQEASWQRFRAFRKGFDTHRALRQSVTRAIALWCGLILIALLLHVTAAVVDGSKLTSMNGVLESLRSVNDWWFPFAVFPVMAVAALSAMYSTADTCVSALLYLLLYFNKSGETTSRDDKRLPRSYYVSMFAIFCVALLTWWFVRVYFHPTILQLVFSVFSNLVVIAPTVLATTLLPPPTAPGPDRLRTRVVLLSLIGGTIAYWCTSGFAIAGGSEYLWLSQLSIVAGLAFASLPFVVVFVWKKLVRSRNA